MTTVSPSPVLYSILFLNEPYASFTFDLVSFTVCAIQSQAPETQDEGKRLNVPGDDAYNGLEYRYGSLE
jgi:hypothetical protein